MNLDQPYLVGANIGTGWLCVQVSELKQRGIAGKISQYSKVSPDGETAYLKFNEDAAVFLGSYLSGCGKLPSILIGWYHPEEMESYPSYPHTDNSPWEPARFVAWFADSESILSFIALYTMDASGDAEPLIHVIFGTDIPNEETEEQP